MQKSLTLKNRYSTGRITSPPRLSSVFSGGCPILGATWPESLYLFGNEFCTGATVCVPTERAMSATSGTRAIGSPPLG